MSATSISSGPGTVDGYNLILNTIFSPPAACTTAITLTQLPLTDYPSATTTDDIVLWYNIISVAPDISITSCFPSQFYSSALAPSSISLPAFQQIVCPADWEVYNLTESYVVCCPSGFELYTPDDTDPVRPGLNAQCHSELAPRQLFDLVVYNGNSSTLVPGTRAGSNGAFVLASAFDGTVASVTFPPTTTAMNAAITTSEGLSGQSSPSSQGSSLSMVGQASGTSATKTSAGMGLIGRSHASSAVTQALILVVGFVLLW